MTGDRNSPAARVDVSPFGAEIDAVELTFELPPAFDPDSRWIWDAMHCPRPVPRLAGDCWQRWMAAGPGVQMTFVNGYAYMLLAPPAPPERPESAPQEDPGVAWRDFYLPGVTLVCDELKAEEYSGMPSAALAGEVARVLGQAGRAFALTMAALTGLSDPVERLFLLLRERLGTADAARATAALLQGEANDTILAGKRMEAIASIAEPHSELVQQIASGSLEGISRVEAGPEFLAAFARFLDDFGWATGTWLELQSPTWREAPQIPLGIIRRYIGNPGRRPSTAHEEAAVLRADAARETAGRLPAEDRPEFERIASAVRTYVPVIEGRARWQVTLAGLLRRPIAALGNALEAEGALPAAGDVFHLALAEVDALAAGGSCPPFPVIAGRKAVFEQARRVIPPLVLGAPLPERALGSIPFLAMMMGTGLREPSDDPRLINGIGVSRGTATGRARVILDLAEAHRLEPGDVLVCPFTAPPWTPLFSIASAVVTNTGGILSHTAIAAREYGVPAVAGTRDATVRIRDGALVTVDGGQGLVRIEA